MNIRDTGAVSDLSIQFLNHVGTIQSGQYRVYARYSHPYQSSVALPLVALLVAFRNENSTTVMFSFAPVLRHMPAQRELLSRLVLVKVMA